MFKKGVVNRIRRSGKKAKTESSKKIKQRSGKKKRKVESNLVTYASIKTFCVRLAFLYIHLFIFFLLQKKRSRRKVEEQRRRKKKEKI